MLGAISFTCATALLWRAAALRRDRRARTVFADRATWERKRRAVLTAGPSKVLFLVDFDRTLTTHLLPNGERGPSCHGIVEARREPEWLARVAALNAHYYSIETCAVRSTAEKIPHMVSWYARANELIGGLRLSRATVAEDVAAARLAIRGGFRELLAAASSHAMPVCILSAGIGDVIEEVLRQHVGLHEPTAANIHVVSNRMVWEGSGAGAVCTAFHNDVIHMFNKSATQLPDATRASLAGRSAVVLVGDSEGDATMADGLAGVDVVLKIGLLNDAARERELLPRYLALFDVVLLRDAPAWDLRELVADLCAAADEERGSAE
jgi:5'-nucleotidase